MKNKGFTLVELLAVIAVLLILITLITPKVINQLNSSEDVTQQEQINTLINIAKIYTNQNTEKLPENNSISVITVQELKESGLINKSQILDPKTKEELTGCILIKDENNKYNYEYNEDTCNNLITVTFDPQGGQLDQTSKNVIPNETYGELPTPTREGYTFMGWNGKNMFDEKSILMAIAGAKYEDGHYVFSAAQAHNAYGGITGDSYIGTKQMNIEYKENTRYTLTINGYSEYIESANRYGNLYYGFFCKEGKKLSTVREENIYKMTNDANTTVENISFSYGLGGKAYISYIQLEEGSVSTPYEPYYITPTTTVVQENNHTLKAIWQANS